MHDDAFGAGLHGYEEGHDDEAGGMEVHVQRPGEHRGYYYDTESGFYYLQSRYYDPEICRFISADGQLNIDTFLGYNQFAYCYNNPILYYDNLGRDGQVVELGGGWFYRIDKVETQDGVKRHIHIYNKSGDSYSQNEDGSPHDKGNNSQGKLPKKLQKKVLEKAKWDYNGMRDEFFKGVEQAVDENMKVTIKYPDGTIRYAYPELFMPPLYRPADTSLSALEKYYFSNDTISSAGISGIAGIPVVPIIPPIYAPAPVLYPGFYVAPMLV